AVRRIFWPCRLRSRSGLFPRESRRGYCQSIRERRSVRDQPRHALDQSGGRDPDLRPIALQVIDRAHDLIAKPLKPAVSSRRHALADHAWWRYRAVLGLIMSGVIAAMRRTLLSCTSLLRDGAAGAGVAVLVAIAPARAEPTPTFGMAERVVAALF